MVLSRWPERLVTQNGAYGGYLKTQNELAFTIFLSSAMRKAVAGFCILATFVLGPAWLFWYAYVNYAPGQFLWWSCVVCGILMLGFINAFFFHSFKTVREIRAKGRWLVR